MDWRKYKTSLISHKFNAKHSEVFQRRLCEQMGAYNIATATFCGVLFQTWRWGGDRRGATQDETTHGMKIQ